MSVPKHQLLVVEDDADVREALLDLLEQQGCDPVGVSNGAEALTYLRATTSLPCLILLDLMMPVMDGPAFREAQLKDPRLAPIPVVIISAYRDGQDQAKDLAAQHFIRKPPELRELMSAVATYC